MTAEQFNKIKWTMVSCTTTDRGDNKMYKSNTSSFIIYKSVYVPIREGHATNVSNIIYVYRGSYYKDVGKLLEAINK